MPTPNNKKSPGIRRTPRTAAALLGLLGSLAVVALAGCAGTGAVLAHDPEPTARVLAIHVGATAAHRADLRVDLAFENPGAAVRVLGSEYQVLLGNRVFAAGATRLEATVPARATTELSLPVQLAFLELPARARERLERGESVALVVRGTLRFQLIGANPDSDPTRPVEFDGQTDVSDWEGAADDT